jgi:hypothetical protein
MAISLADVETAISAVQTSGQSYQLGDLVYNQANLDALLRLRTKLQAEAGRTAGTRPVFRAVNLTGMGYG